VIVRDGVTLGEGWHRRRGDAHAEAEALEDARARDNDVRGASVFVSLEPCDHYGRTPPCSQALIAAGIARVVIGALDPDPATAEAGVRRLRDAGIAVEISGDPAAALLVDRFAWTANHDRPYVTLKMAMSLDGFVAPRAGVQYRLTGAEAQQRVRELRIDQDAVKVGAGTVRIDDPLLTVRPHASRRKPYTRIVACERDPIPSTARVLQPPEDAPEGSYAPTIVLAPAGARAAFRGLLERADVIFVGGEEDRTLDLAAALRALRAREITTVLCEGGPTLAGGLLAGRLVQRVLWFVAPAFLNAEGAVPVLSGAALAGRDGWHFDGTEAVGDDMLLTADLTTCSPD
jgi:diaminohydroxyphosphoribosylaminopyrimidine deaminase/5-amino-6-(5-phosphoribosylamino)uracil reductase